MAHIRFLREAREAKLFEDLLSQGHALGMSIGNKKNCQLDEIGRQLLFDGHRLLQKIIKYLHAPIKLALTIQRLGEKCGYNNYESHLIHVHLFIQEILQRKGDEKVG